MEKAKYIVLVNGYAKATYVTTTRNTEDMIQTLRGLYDTNIYRFNIVKEVNKVRNIVYSNRDKNYLKTEKERNYELSQLEKLFCNFTK